MDKLGRLETSAFINHYSVMLLLDLEEDIVRMSVMNVGERNVLRGLVLIGS